MAQRWSPDTCGCRIDMESDWTLIGFQHKCEFHSALSDADAWDAIWAQPSAENRRKNKVEAALKDLDIGLSDFSAETGTWEWKPGVGFSWQWTGSGLSRVLEVDTFGIKLNAQKKAQAQAWADAAFGAGKVLVV